MESTMFDYKIPVKWFDGHTYQLPEWTPIVAFIAVLIPYTILIRIYYILIHALPTLAILSPSSSSSLARLYRTATLRQHIETSSIFYVHGSLLALAFYTTFWGLFLQNVSMKLFFVPALLFAIVLAPLRAAWVHTVLAPLPHQPWYRTDIGLALSRLPPCLPAIKASAVPVFIRGVSWLFALHLLHALGIHVPSLYDLHHIDLSDLSIISPCMLVVVPALIFAMTMVFSITDIPGTVLLTRVQASLIPDDDGEEGTGKGSKVVVEFDKTFNKKVVPGVLGGRGYATVRDAWETLAWGDWARILGVYARVYTLWWVTFVVVSAAALAPAGAAIFAYTEA